LSAASVAEKLKEYRSADSAQTSALSTLRSCERERDWQLFELELEVLQKAVTNSLTVDGLSEWKGRLASASTPSMRSTRLMLTVLRCMLNSVDDDRMNRADLVGTHKESQYSWDHVRDAVKELESCVDKLCDCLYRPLNRFIEGHRVSEEDKATLFQVLDLFEIR
jgi:hypothetical protein